MTSLIDKLAHELL